LPRRSDTKHKYYTRYTASGNKTVRVEYRCDGHLHPRKIEYINVMHLFGGRSAVERARTHTHTHTRTHAHASSVFILYSHFLVTEILAVFILRSARVTSPRVQEFHIFPLREFHANTTAMFQRALTRICVHKEEVHESLRHSGQTFEFLSPPVHLLLRLFYHITC